MSSNETPAGRFTRLFPELDDRERGAILSENSSREWGQPGWAGSDRLQVEQRAEDARAMAEAKQMAVSLVWVREFSGRDEGELVWHPLYWAAIP